MYLLLIVSRASSLWGGLSQGQVVPGQVDSGTGCLQGKLSPGWLSLGQVVEGAYRLGGNIGSRVYCLGGHIVSRVNCTMSLDILSLGTLSCSVLSQSRLSWVPMSLHTL